MKKFIICNRSHFWQRFSVNKEPIADFLAPYERLVEERDMFREERLGENFYDAEFTAKQTLVLLKEAEKKKADETKQKEAVNKEIEQRIKYLVELTGISVDEATIQVAKNMEEAEGAAGPVSRKQTKGKGKKRTRKSRRI